MVNQASSEFDRDLLRFQCNGCSFWRDRACMHSEQLEKDYPEICPLSPDEQKKILGLVDWFSDDGTNDPEQIEAITVNGITYYVGQELLMNSGQIYYSEGNECRVPEGDTLKGKINTIYGNVVGPCLKSEYLWELTLERVTPKNCDSVNQDHLPLEFNQFVGRNGRLCSDVGRRPVKIRKILENAQSVETADVLQVLREVMTDTTLRVTVIEALGKNGTLPAIQLLIPLLKDEYPWVRKNAVKALWKLGNTEATQAVIEALADRSVRISIIDALGEIRATQALKPLLGLLSEDDAIIRRNVIRVLGQFDDSQAITPLIPLLNDKSAGVRKKAAELLVRMGWEPENNLQERQYLIASQMWDELIELYPDCAESLIALLSDEDSSVRDGVALALGYLGDTSAVNPLIKALTDENNAVRRLAASALGMLGDGQAVNALLVAMQDEDEWVREAASEALGKLGDIGTMDTLVECLLDDNMWIRLNAAAALDGMGWEPTDDIHKAAYVMSKGTIDEAKKLGANPFISIINKRKNRGVPIEAIKILRKIGDARAVEPLIGLLTDKDKYVRFQAAFALGELGDPRAVEPLINTLTDEDERVRVDAAEALGKLGDPRAVEPLISAMVDESWNVRTEAISALGLIRDPRAFQALSDATKDVPDAASKKIRPHLKRAWIHHRRDCATKALGWKPEEEAFL